MTRFERAVQIWPFLVERAHEKQTVYYTELAELIKFVAPANRLNGALGCITKYCIQHPNGLPQLTVLVVKKKTGKPPINVLIPSGDFDLECKIIYERCWDQMPPTADDFRKADPPRRRKKAQA